MEKVKLSKTELALLDALIAEMQEDEGTESAMRADSATNWAFIGGITRVTRTAFKITTKVTPVTIQLVGGKVKIPGMGTRELGEVLDSDGETLSVDQLIELRKSAS